VFKRYELSTGSKI